MNAIGGVGNSWNLNYNSWDLNRNLWIFIRNAWVQRHVHPPMPELVSHHDIPVPEKAMGTGPGLRGRAHRPSGVTWRHTFGRR